jgi:hypothetical protein
MSEIDDNPNSIPTEENPQKKYEILKEDYKDYDLSFKVVIIGNSGNYYKFKIMNKYRCWENKSFESRN